jgi:hypothetical protein
MSYSKVTFTFNLNLYGRTLTQAVSRQSKLSPIPFHVRFVLDCDTFPSEHPSFPLSLSFQHLSFYTSLLLEGQPDEACRRFTKPADVPRSLQTFHEACRRSTKPADVPQGLQTFYEACRRSTKPADVPRSLQTFHKACRCSTKHCSVGNSDAVDGKKYRSSCEWSMS